MNNWDLVQSPFISWQEGAVHAEKNEKFHTSMEGGQFSCHPNDEKFSTPSMSRETAKGGKSGHKTISPLL